MYAYKIKKVRAPANSPDLNPIELIWSDLKHFIRRKFCSNWDQVRLAIHEYYQTLTPEKCSNFIDTLHQVVNYII